MSDYDIPDYTMSALQRYVDDYVPPGGFLQGVLTNDLVRAFGSADENNMKALMDIMRYIWNEIPANCWGSQKAYEKWLARRTDPASGHSQ